MRRAVAPLAWLAALSALLPAFGFGFLRDDWFLLWAHVDPSTAPKGALGVFPRPLGRVYWWLVAQVEQPWFAHLLSVGIALLALLGLWAACRTQQRLRSGALWALACLGLHTALLELRVWAAASNGLLALACGIGGWLLFARGRGRLGAVLLFAGVLARMDAVLAVLLCLGALPRVAFRRWFFALLAGALALVLVLRLAGKDPVFDPWGFAHAARLLLLPWGAGSWPLLDVAAGMSLLALGAWAFPRWREDRAALCMVLATCAACALLPWNVAGRYLAFAVLGLSLLIAAHAPRARWQQALLLLWLVAHLASDLGGNTLRDLRGRSRAETRLHAAALQLPPDCGEALLLVDAPPMGWTDSEADAENVLSFAWRCDARVRFAAAAPQGGLRWDGGDWSVLPGE